MNDLSHNLLYLKATLAGFVIVLAVAFFFPGMRRLMLLGGVALVPSSPLAVLHQQSYWSAERLFGWSYGIEDILFCFSIGSLSVFCGYVFKSSPLILQYTVPGIIKKSSFLLMLLGLLYFSAFLFGFDIMEATIAVQITLALTLISLDGRHGKTAMLGALLYTTYYAAFFILFSYFFPSFPDLWNGRDLWPLRLFSIPFEEIVWVFSFTYMWLNVIGFLFSPETKKTCS
ncbi:MAG: lycopene cyclase domain-containing protein [Desulfopila sp.]|nr:lycopene cyclase domain-containing protein [Desulfopila sp.]